MATVRDDRQGVLQAIEYRDEPAILLFADSERGFERGRRTAGLAGCRVARELPIEAANAIDLAAPGDAAFVDLDADGPGLDSLLDRLNAAADAGRIRAVVAAPAALIDVVAARIPYPDLSHLADASEAERITALAHATARRPARLHDIGRDGAAVLHQLSEEVGRIASILASLSGEEAAAAPEEGQSSCARDAAKIEAGYIRSIIRARRARDRFIRGGLFADPAWDMLLDLLAARLEGNRVAVSSLCIAASVPATTALRWIKTLTDEGLLVRTADSQDGRRVYIDLADETAQALIAYFTTLQRWSSTVI